MKLLVTSAANKVPLIECIKKTVNLNIIASDANPNNLAQYFSDGFWQMPLLKDLNIEEFILYCQKHHISYVLPTRGPDLVYFSSYKSQLEKEGIFVHSSSIESLMIANDKLNFYDFLHSKGLPAIPTFTDLDKFKSLPSKFVIKERNGAGSKNLFLNVSYEEVKSILPTIEAPIIQPMITGEEYSIDVYVTRNKKVKATVVRKRSLVIDGESQITEIVDHPRLESLIKETAIALELEGHVMFQAFEDDQGKLWIIECNPRIGGASTLSIYAGLDTFNWWIAECNGENIDDWPVEIKNVKQIRYKKDLIL